jgi:hypothetical protein
MLSCKQRDQSLFEFDPRNLDKNEISLSQIADDISYTPLDNSIKMGEIYDNHFPKFINNSIFLYENDIGILVYDQDGKFLRKVGSIGRGPGEYISGLDFTVDEKTETVYVLDNFTSIKVYSKSGNFLRSFSLQKFGDYINTIEFFNSNLFISFAIQFENANYEWIVLDTLGKPIKMKDRTSPIFISNVGGAGDGIYKFDNRLSYYNNYTDTVFSVLPDLTEKASFIISPGEHRLPKSKVTVEEISNCISLRQLLETKQFLTIRYTYQKKYNLVIIDRKTRESFVNNWDFKARGGILNDFDGGLKFLPISYLIKSGREYLVGLISPYEIKALVESIEFKNVVPKFPEKKKELETLANSIEEIDNPILVLVKLKK